MPELPEVETIRSDLAEVLVGDTITRVNVTLPKLIRGQSVETFRRAILNQKISAIRRRAKLLIIDLKDAHLTIHLKMTGQLFWVGPQHELIAGGHTLSTKAEDFTLPNRHTHITLQLKSGATLYFNDLRQFGYFELLTTDALTKTLTAFGPEPLDGLDLTYFTTLLARHPRATIKAVLLDQKGIAGLGNIYVDESCFRAKVRPTRRVATLTTSEIERLRQAIPEVLNEAIKYRGTTFNNYRDAQGRHGNFVSRLKVYGRTGQSCLRCQKGIIKKTTVAGRGTHYCSHCQA